MPQCRQAGQSAQWATPAPAQMRTDRAALVALTAAAAMLVITSAAVAAAPAPGHYENRSTYEAPRAPTAPVVDGIAAEAIWEAAPWQALDQRWLGPEYSATDFQGRFKVVWTAERIYLLAEIVDDILIDRYRDPLVQYWDDDCLEVFVDEDFSGGEHQYNHNAFAYHFSLDNRAIDIGTDRAAREYTHHVASAWRQHGEHFLWEVAIDIYPDSYTDGSAHNAPVTLTAGKIIGLMVAYCDNDGSELRENFIGSESVPSGPKDRGWIDAGLFGALKLLD
jgi:hypothetical protein